MNAIVVKGHWAFLLSLLVFWLMPPNIGTATEQIPVKPIALMTLDDDGRQLNYPTTIFYDGVQDEIYLVNGGTSRVIVYGPDYFPGVSIGVGRGIEAPRGGVVLENGDVYILQDANVNSKRPRVTILNGAFFVEREIFLDEIREASEFSFSLRELAVSRDGVIYVAGSSSRGVLVLDNKGNFLRYLKPLDRTQVAGNKEGAEKTETASEMEQKGTEILSAPTNPETLAEPEAETAPDIPEEYQPRGGGQGDVTSPLQGLNPVRINHVTIDSKGRIYLISAEMSKIYVYGPDEKFLFSFGRKGGTPRYLSHPRALAVDEKRGVIYVLDYMRHTILTYNMKGEYLFEFGGRGGGPGWFNFPTDMAINAQGQLIVADLFNRRAQVVMVDYDEFSPTLKSQFGFTEGTSFRFSNEQSIVEGNELPSERKEVPGEVRDPENLPDVPSKGGPIEAVEP